MTTLDQGHSWSRISGQVTVAGECRACAIAQRVADSDLRPRISYDDDVVVVISLPELVGPVVVPRQHVGGLEELSVARRARVLAALWRVTQSVREENPGAAARIVALTDLPESAGHVCFQVVISGSENPPVPH